jgi:hypothetical protein
LFGGSARGENLPRLKIPFRRDELRPGYSISKREFAGRERHALVDQSGMVVAIAGVEDLVELSHYLDATERTIEDSYLSPGGKPLFGVRDSKNSS